MPNNFSEISPKSSQLQLLPVSYQRNVENPDFKPNCLVGGPDIYDPTQAEKVPWFDVNLDLPPRQRFKQIAAAYKDDIRAVFDVLNYFLTIIPGVNAWELIGNVTASALDKGMIMNPYKDEVLGIAEVLEVPIGNLVFLNIFYEMSRFCTSIVAQTEDNKDLYHARNLDFGQLFVWDIDAQSWGLTDALKKVSVNINFFKNGKLVFKGSTLAGHVGVLTAMKPHKFSLSMNAKVQPDLINVAKWYMGAYENTDLQFVMYFERWLFENCDDFQCARQKIAEVKLLTGAYFILGGVNPGEGSVLVRNTTSVQFERKLFDGDNDWFLLQTNYDPDKNPLFIDNRRDPGNACMKKLTRAGVGMKGIYTVLSSKPNLNKTTVHTVLMSVTKGYFETFVQKCPNPCWAF
ncbi:hypothetical protein GCK72_004307 [Caenorhabditis remanei]|uniref:Ceramidase n=2 Tax=Caenorhabditis TaxID=6237 RepID=A0A6A5H961_CAERE|nr:hypothetical protein GCK72_004307 [Caenorhabditis remanei]KAF1764360.1 hypothetical protein GCK72_004307 [Caenorhabditis remanei]